MVVILCVTDCCSARATFRLFCDTQTTSTFCTLLRRHLEIRSAPDTGLLGHVAYRTVLDTKVHSATVTRADEHVSTVQIRSGSVDDYFADRVLVALTQTQLGPGVQCVSGGRAGLHVTIRDALGHVV